MPRRLPWRPWIWAALAAAVTFALGLTTHDFGRDEAVTVLVADMPLGPALRLLARSEVNPAGFYTLMHFWPHASEWAARLPTYVAAVVAVPALIVAAQRFGIPGGIAGVLAATSPFLAYFAAEARPYAILVVLSTVALILTWDLLVGVRRRRAARLLALAATLAAALYVHYFAAFLVAVILIALGLWAPARRDAVRTAGLALLFFFPGALMLVGQLALAPALSTHGWQRLVRLLELWETPRVLLAGRQETVVAAILTLLLAGAVGLGAWGLRRSRGGQLLLLFVGVQLVVPLLLGTVVRAIAPWYLCGALPALLLPAAWGIHRLRAELVLVPVALGLTVILGQAFGDDIQKPPIRTALAALPRDGLPPVVGGGRFAPPLAVYTHGEVSYAFEAPTVDYLGLWALPPGRPLPRAARISVFDHCTLTPAVPVGYAVDHRQAFPSDLCVYTEVSTALAGSDLEAGFPL